MSYIRRVGYILMVLVGSAAVVSTVWQPPPPPRFIGLQTQDIPRDVGGYNAPDDYEMPPEVKVALNTADVVSRKYLSTTDQIDFVLLGGTSREALHDPRSCLTGAGWLLADDHTERLPDTDVDVHACHAIGLPGMPGFDVLYLYVVNGRRISSVGEIRTQMLVSALLGKANEPVYMLRFMEPLGSDPQQNIEAHHRMIQFATDMWNTLKPQLEASES